MAIKEIQRAKWKQEAVSWRSAVMTINIARAVTQRKMATTCLTQAKKDAKLKRIQQRRAERRKLEVRPFTGVNL